MKRKPSPAVEAAGTVVFAGNPNVGKSTVFNALTGMRQHTGNWSGKTVGCAVGAFTASGKTWRAVDLPGCCSLLTRSAEEEQAREYLMHGGASLTVVVCDACCMERCLNLALQIMELTDRVLICVNLMDEAARRGIRLDLPLLEARLGVPVVGICARRRSDVRRLAEEISRACGRAREPYRITYPEPLRRAAERIAARLTSAGTEPPLAAWSAMRILDGTLSPPSEEYALLAAQAGEDAARVSDTVAGALVTAAENLCRGAVTDGGRVAAWARADRILTGRVWAFPVMFLLLAGLFWITLVGANVPSERMSAFFTSLEAPLLSFLLRAGLPPLLCDMLVCGVWRTLTTVIAVMLPPMAIFFPLFTLLEDVGYLPRIAYNLDRCFFRCGSCGKHALTLCMGIGCNAVGVTGCRIIDSPRERRIAVLTNSFIPCNGRFPLLLLLSSLFLAGSEGVLGSALALACAVVLSCGAVLAVSALLSRTLYAGMPSAIVLDMPPYRRPAVLTVLVRSVLDRTAVVLGRAAAIAAPAGMVLWLLARPRADGVSMLAAMSGALDPLGRLLGMDGMILCAFLLGFPANETVLPILLMGYLAEGALPSAVSLAAVRDILLAHGWTPWTAVCVMLFSLMHWPCSTTLWTIRRETGSFGQTVLAFFLPTACGVLACATVHGLSLLLSAP